MNLHEKYAFTFVGSRVDGRRRCSSRGGAQTEMCSSVVAGACGPLRNSLPTFVTLARGRQALRVHDSAGRQVGWCGANALMESGVDYFVESVCLSRSADSVAVQFLSCLGGRAVRVFDMVRMLTTNCGYCDIDVSGLGLCACRGVGMAFRDDDDLVLAHEDGLVVACAVEGTQLRRRALSELPGYDVWALGQHGSSESGLPVCVDGMGRVVVGVGSAVLVCSIGLDLLFKFSVDGPVRALCPAFGNLVWARTDALQFKLYNVDECEAWATCSVRAVGMQRACTMFSDRFGSLYVSQRASARELRHVRQFDPAVELGSEICLDYREYAVAVAMAQHARLGAGSMVGALSSELVRMILGFAIGGFFFVNKFT